MTGYSTVDIWLGFQNCALTSPNMAAGQTNSAPLCCSGQWKQNLHLRPWSRIDSQPQHLLIQITQNLSICICPMRGYATDILMQDTPLSKQPLAYYSTKLDNVEAGFPPCYQGSVAAPFAFEKAGSLTMGHPVTLYTSYQLHALLSSLRFVITQARRIWYEVILSAPELTTMRCYTVNPASRMMIPDEETPHDQIV